MSNTYSSETKAAVMAALLAGQSISSVAREYKIPKGTVGGWKRKAFEGVGGVATEKNEKAEEIGNLLVEYLSENLVTLREQSKAFRNVDWIKEQNAADMAVLHGVLTDKAIRLMEALSASSDTGNA